MTYQIDSGLSSSELNVMEERRLELLHDAGINERKVLDEAKENINVWQNYFNENITRGKDDMNFVLRDQWTAVERSEFSRLFKPAMTFNKLYEAIKKIVGEQRKNKPDLLVRSLTGKSTQEQINLRSDLVRTISYQSQNDLVYQTAFKSALMMGFGAFHIDIDYESPKSFNQIIRFNMIPDPTRTSFDPTAIKPHKGDGNFCSRQYIFTKEEFEATYPYLNHADSYADPRSLLDFQWLTKDTIVVADYYVKEWFPEIIYHLSNGMVVNKDEWDAMQESFKNKRMLAEDAQVVGGIILKEIPEIKNTRQTQNYRIRHYRLIKNQIIDFAEWPSKQLPIIFVDGDSYYIEGKQYTRSFIHEARDAQKFINYVGSEIAAEIKNRRREQWMGTPDNIIGNEQLWRNPELQSGILIAKPDPKTGQMPQKMPPWDLSPALLQNYQRGTQDIKEILGVSETEQLQGRDISGQARRERKLEASMSSYVFSDNLNQAIEQAGRVVLDLLPIVYGKDERNVVINKKDGSSQNIVLNKKIKEDEVENELKTGDYDIEIDTGPAFAVQKEVALEFFQQTIANSPNVFPLIADLWAANLDIQQRQQVVDRFKTMVPPQIIAKEKGEPPPPPAPPSPQDQLMQAELQERAQALQERKNELSIREEKHQLEKAEMFMKFTEMKARLASQNQSNQLQAHKTDLDFTSKIAETLSSLHDKHMQRQHEKEMAPKK